MRFCGYVALCLCCAIAAGCGGQPDGTYGQNGSTAELQWQVRSLQREVEELREARGNLVEEMSASTSASAASAVSREVLAKIRDEGFSRSQVMATLSYLTDVIGPRLTGSPELARANEWTRSKMESWGLVNAHVEPWGPFGRGWSLKRFSAQIVEPQAIPLIGYPKAWSPGLKGPLTADVIHVDAKTEADLEQFKGKLKGAIVLQGSIREVQARFEPLALRTSDTNLLLLANSEVSTVGPSGQGRGSTAAERAASFADTPVGRALSARSTTRPTTQSTTLASRPTTGPAISSARILAFLEKEGAALVVTSSTQGDGGTLFVSSASIPGVERQAFNPTSTTQPSRRVWSMEQKPVPPQITLAVEHFNRLVRMIQAGEKLKMAVELGVEFHDNVMGYNTIAEIEGADLKDQIVMLGAHLDSWHSSTGATDNGAGVAACMEAVRILKALDLKPRRTIRVGFWTGEEQGLFGSKAYVTEHFGSYPEPTTRPSRGRSTTRPSTQPARNLIKRAEYDKLSAYFNLDNGTGKIRGIYLQGNEAARPIFRRWLTPFADLGASTITLSNTGGTDHIPFDAIGLPGFQFIQDPIEYWSRTHHSNADSFERAQADDLKQASVILATFVYNAAMMDERFPRKTRFTAREAEAREAAQTQPAR